MLGNQFLEGSEIGPNELSWSKNGVAGKNSKSDHLVWKTPFIMHFGNYLAKFGKCFF